VGFLTRVFGRQGSVPPGDTETLVETEDGVRLRRMRWETDADEVCGFQDDVYTTNFPDFRMTRHFMEGFSYDLRRGLADPNHGAFVLQHQGKLVGFLWVVIYESGWTRQKYGYVNNVYVHPGFRGRGLGRLLIDYTDRFLRERGVPTARLTVTASNEVAVHLYERAGYHVQRYEMSKRLTAG